MSYFRTTTHSQKYCLEADFASRSLKVLTEQVVLDIGNFRAALSRHIFISDILDFTTACCPPLSC